MEEFVFGVKGKGETLHGFLLIAMGEREKGMSILKQYIGKTESQVKSTNRLQNLKERKLLKKAQEVFNVVQLNKSQFFNNVSNKHEHTGRITNVQFSDNSSFFTTICGDICRVWRMAGNLIGAQCTIPAKLDEEHIEESAKPIAVVDNKCTMVAIYRGKMMFQIYEIRDMETFRKKDTIHLRKELITAGVNDFDFTPSRDSVNSLRFVGGDDATHLKIYMTVRGEEYMSTVKLNDMRSDLVQQPKYAD